MLASEGAARLGPSRPAGLRAQMGRAYAHADMKDVCRSFERGNLPISTQHLVALPIEPDLQRVAKRFSQLQEARHEADYDTTAILTRMEALQRVDAAEDAFAAWQAVRQAPNATVFLAAMMLQRQWRR